MIEIKKIQITDDILQQFNNIKYTRSIIINIYCSEAVSE